MNESQEAVIHVVDDDASIRGALSRLLTCSGYAVRCYASAGDYLVTEPDVRPGCMLLDLEMPGPGGLALQQALIRQGAAMPIVFMSAHADIPRTVQAIKAGASDFLLKPLEAQDLFAAIECAFAAELVRAQPTQTKDSLPTQLNEREYIVLRGILAGRLNKQLAADLDLSERSIKSCRASLMRKLGARSLTDLVRLGMPLLQR